MQWLTHAFPVLAAILKWLAVEPLHRGWPVPTFVAAVLLRATGAMRDA